MLKDHIVDSRRAFLRQSALTTTTALGTLAFPSNVHAGMGEGFKVGLVGCGGRGTGAAIDTLKADTQARIVAIGDAFSDRASSSLTSLQSDEDVGDRVVVDEDHVFSGFDAYKSVVDSDVDIVILATPPHFRPQHLAYAVERGKHCFVEKPVGVDVPGVLSVKETCELAKKKGLAIVTGLCYRYDNGVRATMDQIHQGAIGDIVAIESTYLTDTLWHRGDMPDWSRMEYQIRNWLYYTWLSGDHIVEQAIHSLDKTSWIMSNTTPMKAVGIGGRQQRTDKKFGHIFDHHTVFFEFDNTIPVYFACRQQTNCKLKRDEVVHGTKGKAYVLKNRIEGENEWRFKGSRKTCTFKSTLRCTIAFVTDIP